MLVDLDTQLIVHNLLRIYHEGSLINRHLNSTCTVSMSKLCPPLRHSYESIEVIVDYDYPLRLPPVSCQLSPRHRSLLTVRGGHIIPGWWLC